MFKLKKPRSRKAPVVMRKNEDARVNAENCSDQKPVKAKIKAGLKRLTKAAAIYWLKQGVIYLWDNREIILGVFGMGS
ncbi:hypothetical protein K8U54_15600 [Pseudomonas fulva]|uniref:hypothetical protein n=1 Tax=Pseudomonas fulva TaxID=47880 RepID=UPI00201D77E5|nr:hypothetical protein [Pseudomonas fulva]UQY33144.1 hypothetical protein K8U54_15600 [Pseudomonas fulva]